MLQLVHRQLDAGGSEERSGSQHQQRGHDLRSRNGSHQTKQPKEGEDAARHPERLDHPPETELLGAVTLAQKVVRALRHQPISKPLAQVLRQPLSNRAARHCVAPFFSILRKWETQT